jgi:ankyrin repeat protein
MPTKTLPESPSLENLRKLAKRLKKDVQAGDTTVTAQVKEFHPRGEQALSEFALNDAQLVVARSYGFASWAKLKEHLEVVKQFEWNPREDNSQASETPAELLIRLSCLAYDGAWRPPDAERGRQLLEEHPELARGDIYVASAVGDVESARKAIGNDPAIVHRRGGPLDWEPLLYACYSRLKDTGTGYSTLEVAKILLDAGADPNTGFLWKGNIPPFTALTGAFGNGEAGSNEPEHEHWRELARILLEAGADPNDGQTLYNRHFNESDEHLDLLFEFGLGQDKGGPWFKRLGERLQTPSQMLVEELWSAARKNYFARAKLLVEHGTNVNTPGCRDGRTPYESAVRAGNLEIADYLVEHGSKPTNLSSEEAFAAACINGRREEVRTMLLQDPEIVSRVGLHRRIELLHRAVEGKRLDGIRLMAELGFEINGITRHDNVGMYLATTPLHNAAWMGNLELVKLLIELGADINAHDPNYNSTPLGWATYNNQKDVVEYLTSLGAGERE